MNLIRLAAAFVAISFLSSSAVAGDVAEMEIIGFTPDGRVFVFEEFGRQDGSGFPYSHRYYIDTASDRFLPGTPIRVRIEDENASLDSARRRALRRGDAVLREAELVGNPGISAGFNPVTEISADPFRMSVLPRPVFPPLDAPLEFRIEQLPLAPPKRCEEQGEVAGFALTRIDPAPDGRTRLLHRDDAIPLSRGCPTGYRIGGVQTFFPAKGAAVFAVLIAVQRVGFEGPDFRWLAVTGRI